MDQDIDSSSSNMVMTRSAQVAQNTRSPQPSVIHVVDIPHASDTTANRIGTQRDYSSLVQHRPGLSQNTPSVEHPASSKPGLWRQLCVSAEALKTLCQGRMEEVPLQADLVEVIRAGNSFIRVDASDFITLRLNPILADFWGIGESPRPMFNGKLAHAAFRSFRCAEVLRARSEVDILRLRFARLLLYHYAEQLIEQACSSPDMLARRSRGRSIASIALDTLTEQMFPHDRISNLTTFRECRNSLKEHKRIGRRWSILRNNLGSGLLIICSSTLAALT